MKLINEGSNQNSVILGYDSIFFSYETPVAALVDGEYFRTEKFWSVTTSRHINNWLDGVKATEKPQEFFDNLIGDI